MSAHELITGHLGLWTKAVTKKSTAGRRSNGKVELTGIKKLRELILELAVRGKLVEQDPDDESVELLLNKIESEKCAQLEAKTIRKPKKLPSIERAEQPFSIPNNWRYCRLNDIGTWGSGATPKRGNLHYYGGKIPWFKSGELYKDFINRSEETITDLAVQETSVRMNQPGDVLIAMYGATIGKASILEVAGTTNQAVCACTPWQGISNRFLLLLLKAYRARFIAMGAGGAQPNISRDKIIATVIGLPPEQEQHRIVQKVDELMALCDRLEQQTSDQLDAHETLVDTLLGTLTQSDNATELADNWARLAEHFDTLFTTEQSIDKLKQSILQLAVMGRLVEQDAEDEPASILLGKIAEDKVKVGSVVKAKAKKPPTDDCRSLSQLPRGWVWVRIQSLLLGDTQNGLSKKADKKPEGVPLLRISAATTNQNYIVDENDFNLTSTVTEEQLLKYKLEPQDLLAVRFNGNRSFVGRTALFQGDKNNLVVYPDKLIRLRFPVDFVVPRLVSLFMNSRTMREEIEKYCATTVGNWGISAKNLKQVFIPLPPLAEQHRIVQKVDELMALCDHLKQRLTQASNTRSKLAGAVVEGALEG